MEGICGILQFVALLLISKIVMDFIFYLISLPFGGCCTMYHSKEPNVFCPRYYTCDDVTYVY
jgi:hypothetical protein